MGFGWFECFLFFMVAGAMNKLRSTLLILLLTSLKLNTQSICGFSCTLLNRAQILLDHFLTQSSFLKMCRDDLPMRQRPVKSPVLRLGLSSSSELEESSLEKSRSLRAALTQDIIF
jgi:hypothetical protein